MNQPPTVAETAFATALALIGAGLLAGCASSPQANAPPPLAEQPREHFAVQVPTPIARDLGHVAFVHQPAQAGLTLERLPLTRSEAAATIRDRVLGRVGKIGGDPGGAIFLYPAVIGLGLAGGWIYGGLSGANEAEVQKASLALTAASRDLTLVERLSEAILTHTAGYPSSRFLLHPEIVPVELPAARLRLRPNATGQLQRVTVAPAPHPLAAQGIDTVAVLHVSTHALRGDDRIRPPLALTILAQVRLFRTRDWSEAGEVIVSYTGTPRDLLEWSQDDARLLRSEWQTAVAGFEQRLVEALSGRPSPTPPAPETTAPSRS